jgi:hypothetical protein
VAYDRVKPTYYLLAFVVVTMARPQLRMEETPFRYGG